MALMRNGKSVSNRVSPLSRFNRHAVLSCCILATTYVLQLFSANVLAKIPGRVWLVDKYLNQQMEINITDTTMYSFAPNSDTNSYRNRFMLVLDRNKYIRRTWSLFRCSNLEIEKIYQKGESKIYPRSVNRVTGRVLP
jgi:hypothetical protein